MHRPWLFFVALGLAACAEQAAEPRGMPGDRASRVAERTPAGGAQRVEIPAGAPRVAFLGDSIAAGLHLASDQAFPAVAQRELAAAGLPFELVNAGVSGDTTAGGLRRVEWLLARQPDVLVVELGGNDGLRGQPLDSVEANLRQIVRKSRAAGARVLLLGVQIPPSLGPDYVNAFERLYERVAEAEGALLVPQFLAGVGGVPAMNLEDGLHPTPQGHERLARNLLPALREALEELPQR